MHILFKQEIDGSIIIGDSHEYADANEAEKLPFKLNQYINELMIEDENGFEYKVSSKQLMAVPDGKEEEQAYNQHTPVYEDVIKKNVNKQSLDKANADFDLKYKKKEASHLHKKGAYMEVDLHIHELIDSEAGLSASDKLDIQVKHFERMMRRAEEQKLSKVVFIHGVGQGVLRHKIRQLLDQFYPGATFHDGNYMEYGHGATEVRLNN